MIWHNHHEPGIGQTTTIQIEEAPGVTLFRKPKQHTCIIFVTQTTEVTKKMSRQKNEMVGLLNKMPEPSQSKLLSKINKSQSRITLFE